MHFAPHMGQDAHGGGILPQLNIAMNVYVGKQDLITILLKALINFQGALEWVDANRLCDLDYADDSLN